MKLRNKTPKLRVKVKLRDYNAEAFGPNDIWPMDFVYDQLATDKKLGVLTVLDTFSRYVRFLILGSAIAARTSWPHLDRVCCRTGYSKTIKAGEGIELIAHNMVAWAYRWP